MKIYTLTQPRLLTITPEVLETQYVEDVPLSVQKKVHIGRYFSVNNKKGRLSIVVMKKGKKVTIIGQEAKVIIDEVNAFSKKNCQFFIR